MITLERMDFIPEIYKKYQFTTNADQSLNDTSLKDYRQNEYAAFSSEETASSDELSIREK